MRDEVIMRDSLHVKRDQQGRNWVILRGERLYFWNRTDEIMHGLSPSVKCVAPLFREMCP